MKIGKKIIVLALVSLFLTACDESNKEKALVEAAKEDSTQSQAMLHYGPDCAQFNKDGTRKVEGGCTKQQWAEWHKTH